MSEGKNDVTVFPFFLLKGPPEWYKSYPIAQGNHQSPIDIIPTQAIYDPCLKPLSISYESCSSIDISNNGHSVMVDFKDVDDKTGKWCMLCSVRGRCQLSSHLKLNLSNRHFPK